MKFRIVLKWFLHRASALWQIPYSRLYNIGDGSNWSLQEDSRAINRLCNILGINSYVVDQSPPGMLRQCLFFQSPYVLRRLPEHGVRSNRIALSYFHGRPSTKESEFTKNYEALCHRHQEVSRIQVSCKAMQEVVLSSGIDPEKVRLIPIGVNISMFPSVTPEKRRAARERLGLKPDDIVVGSFQKDGEGWGRGDRPKLIKGPDVFVDTVYRLYQRKPELHVLLTGPARGYVKNELARRKVPFTHRQIDHYTDMAECYNALDLMLVTSREEGGPKAVLESMACGIPLVSTKVGQAAELIHHGENGWMVEVEDVDGLYSCSLVAMDLGMQAKASILRHARLTAELNDYDVQLPLWKRFFENFVGSELP